MAIWWGWMCLCVGLWLSTAGLSRAQGFVEGFEGDAVILPCTVNIQGHLWWRSAWGMILLIRSANGSAFPPENSPWKDVISFVGSTNNLRISSLSRQRDDNRTFWCEGLKDRRRQNRTVRVLARTTGASVEQAIEGQVTVTERTGKSLTCSITGNPNPPPSYSWRVDNVSVPGQSSNYILTADRSMRSVSCTATNTYSNGSVLSTAEATARLNVLYLDTPRASSTAPVAEDEVATLMCSVEGNPRPTFAWRRPGSAEVLSTSADYRIENVQRSDAGEYTCDVTNTVGSRQTTVRLVVQYPPDVTVTYDQGSHTLTCAAEGVPDTCTFSPWEQRLGGTLIWTLGTQTTGTSVTHSLPDTLTYRDTGEYVCSVTNGVKSSQTGMIYVAPLTPAVFQSHPEKVSISLRKSETVSLSFYSRSSSASVQVRWEKDGRSVAPHSHREEAVVVSLVVYGHPVNLLGTVTILTLTDVSQRDAGNYSVTITTDINGVTRTSSASFYVDVIDEGSAEKDISVECTAAGTGAIAGGVIGGLAAGVIVTVLAGILWTRSRTKDLPEGTDNRQVSPAGELSGEMRTLPRVADTSFDPAVNTGHNYETLAHHNPRSPGTRGQNYELLTAPPSGRENTYENTEVVQPSARVRQRTDVANYENVWSLTKWTVVKSLP